MAEREDLPHKSHVEAARMGMSFGLPSIAGTVLLWLLVVAMALLLGSDPRYLMDPNAVGAVPRDAFTAFRETPTSTEKQRTEVVAGALGSINEMWLSAFESLNKAYVPPKFQAYSGAAFSACGLQRSVVGPFYCPADNAIYFDLTFFDVLAEKFSSPGDFAVEYVIAHEVGHHVQNLLQSGQTSSSAGNERSIRRELQADCFAGVWAHWSAKRKLVTKEGVLDALKAAEQAGDDQMQLEQFRYKTVVEEEFNHGTAEQRSNWLVKGFESGDVAACNTWDAAAL